MPCSGITARVMLVLAPLLPHWNHKHWLWSDPIITSAVSNLFVKKIMSAGRRLLLPDFGSLGHLYNKQLCSLFSLHDGKRSYFCDHSSSCKSVTFKSKNNVGNFHFFVDIILCYKQKFLLMWKKCELIHNDDGGHTEL